MSRERFTRQSDTVVTGTGPDGPREDEMRSTVVGQHEQHAPYDAKNVTPGVTANPPSQLQCPWGFRGCSFRSDPHIHQYGGRRGDRVRTFASWTDFRRQAGIEQLEAGDAD